MKGVSAIGVAAIGVGASGLIGAGGGSGAVADHHVEQLAR